MKLLTKRLLKLSGILCGIGLLISVGGFAMMDFDYRNFATGKAEPIEEKIYSENTQQFSKIKVDTRSKDIEFKGSENNEFKISGAGIEIEDTEGGLLLTNIESPEEDQWYRFFKFDVASSNKIIVEIPKSFIGDIDIKTSYGDIRGENLLKVNGLTCENKQGKIDFNQLEIKNPMNIKTEYGDIALNLVKSGEGSTIDQHQGNIEIKNTTAESLVIQNTYGDMRIENFQGNHLNVNSKQSEIFLENLRSETELNVFVEYGNINFSKVASPLIKLEAEQGDIRGSILGKIEDYRISTFSKQGNSNIEPKLNGNNELYAEAFDRIEISFTEK